MSLLNIYVPTFDFFGIRGRRALFKGKQWIYFYENKHSFGWEVWVLNLMCINFCWRYSRQVWQYTGTVNNARIWLWSSICIAVRRIWYVWRLSNINVLFIAQYLRPWYRQSYQNHKSKYNKSPRKDIVFY